MQLFGFWILPLLGSRMRDARGSAKSQRSERLLFYVHTLSDRRMPGYFLSAGILTDIYVKPRNVVVRLIKINTHRPQPLGFLGRIFSTFCRYFAWSDITNSRGTRRGRWLHRFWANFLDIFLDFFAGNASSPLEKSETFRRLQFQVINSGQDLSRFPTRNPTLIHITLPWIRLVSSSGNVK